MPLAIAFEDAKKVRLEGDGSGTTGGVTQTQFLGSEDHPELPEASLSHRDPGRVSYPHYHLRDQFQVVVGGTGTLGRHDLAPCSVHFARAYTPYGPLASNPSTPFTAFVLRPHYDPGSQHLPEAKDKLNEVPDRRPWQIVRQATFPALRSGTATADAVLQAIPGIKDEQGLAAYTLAMKPNAQARAPDPSDGDGQYLIVVKGSLLHGDKEYKTWGLVFVGPKEGPFQVHAGAEGLEALVLNFPRPRTRVADAAESVQVATGLKTWQCTLCAFVYDEAAGIPEEGIAPGTRWQDVPDTWNCPDCSASKADFQMIELNAERNRGSLRVW